MGIAGVPSRSDRSTAGVDGIAGRAMGAASPSSSRYVRRGAVFALFWLSTEVDSTPRLQRVRDGQQPVTGAHDVRSASLSCRSPPIRRRLGARPPRRGRSAPPQALPLGRAEGSLDAAVTLWRAHEGRARQLRSSREKQVQQGPGRLWGVQGNREAGDTSSPAVYRDRPKNFPKRRYLTQNPWVRSAAEAMICAHGIAITRLRWDFARRPCARVLVAGSTPHQRTRTTRFGGRSQCSRPRRPCPSSS